MRATPRYVLCYARGRVQWRYHAHPLLLSRIVRRRRQQRLWPEGVRVPAARRHPVPARAHLRCLVGAARAIALRRRRRRDHRGQRHDHRPPHRQVPADNRRDTDHLITRMLDDLYWVMSYSRWKDERFWPLFAAALMRTHPSLTAEGLDKARAYNAQRYYFQGIGRYAPDAAYHRGLKDLQVLADLLPMSGYLHGEKPTSIDAGIYGFIANIHFYDIDTPLKQFVSAHANLVRHCNAIHAAVTAPPRAESKSG